MKATGIVRRIDELGRVVIPKEIRRILRIREGDPLEIFTDREGEIILKKYSPIGELSDFAQEYAESLALSSGHTVAICDKDTVIAVSGSKAKEFLNKPINDALERIMQNRERRVANQKDGQEMISITINDIDAGEYTAQVIVPIIAAGDAIGAVIMLSKEPNTTMQQSELLVCETAANFLGKQMES